MYTSQLSVVAGYQRVICSSPAQREMKSNRKMYINNQVATCSCVGQNLVRTETHQEPVSWCEVLWYFCLHNHRCYARNVANGVFCCKNSFPFSPPLRSIVALRFVRSPSTTTTRLHARRSCLLALYAKISHGARKFQR